ncbi:VacJ family lipoprotein, partial [Bordetella hinzii]|nr:VacJ family lipoprotein [Bordetella hinzii]
MKMQALTRLTTIAAAGAVLAGCAAPQHPDPRDPWEG